MFQLELYIGQWNKEGHKRVEIIGADNKKQITYVFAGTLTGDFLSPQLVYKGTTSRCLPTVQFPSDWDITYTEHHWSNEQTMIHYEQKILLPYIAKKKKELKLQDSQRALVIYDQYR